MLAKRYGGRGETCTRGRLRSEQVPQWLRRRNGEDDLIATGSAFSAAKLLCAKLADPAPAPATHGGGPAVGAAPGPSAGHGPRHGARGCGPAPAGTPGRSVGHGPRRGARGCDPAPTSAPGRSAGHGPPPAARGGRPVAVPSPGRSIGQIDAF
ncbi:hypothetical protein BDL97_01G037100 [Sphagnum fallax]|nr:hypothetical protein BDL97_01G037100 [Sphagnum fallax]